MQAAHCRAQGPMWHAKLQLKCGRLRRKEWEEWRCVVGPESKPLYSTARLKSFVGPHVHLQPSRPNLHGFCHWIIIYWWAKSYSWDNYVEVEIGLCMARFARVDYQLAFLCRHPSLNISTPKKSSLNSSVSTSGLWKDRYGWLEGRVNRQLPIFSFS